MHTRLASLALGAALLLPYSVRADEERWPPGLVAVTAAQSAARVRAEKGHPVVLVYWAAWCKDCRVELPALEALTRELGPRGVRLVSVTIDETPAALERLLAERPIPYPYLRLAPIVKADAISAIGSLGGHFTGSIPYLAVFDKQGRLVREWPAGRPVSQEELFSTLQPLL
jgi:thiol-disulfide isomerase/thioredoxin